MAPDDEGEWLDIPLTEDEKEYVRAKAREWFPQLHPEVAEGKAMGRLLNLGLRRIQEDPNAMADFQRFLDGLDPDDD